MTMNLEYSKSMMKTNMWQKKKREILIRCNQNVFYLWFKKLKTGINFYSSNDKIFNNVYIYIYGLVFSRYGNWWLSKEVDNFTSYVIF